MAPRNYGEAPSYGRDEHIRNWGNGTNHYRGEGFAMPWTLTTQDTLADGKQIMEMPREAGNGGVTLTVRGSKHPGGPRLFYERYRIASRFALQLLTDERKDPVYPQDLTAGTILETGDVVLADAEVIDEDTHELYVTGGLEGHRVKVPSDLPFAVSELTLPVDPQTQFGAFVVRHFDKMHPDTKRDLPAPVSV